MSILPPAIPAKCQERARIARATRAACRAAPRARATRVRRGPASGASASTVDDPPARSRAPASRVRGPRRAHLRDGRAVRCAQLRWLGSPRRSRAFVRGRGGRRSSGAARRWGCAGSRGASPSHVAAGPRISLRDQTASLRIHVRIRLRRITVFPHKVRAIAWHIPCREPPRRGREDLR